MSTFCYYEEELFTHVGAHCISYIVLGKTQKKAYAPAPTQAVISACVGAGA